MDNIRETVKRFILDNLISEEDSNDLTDETNLKESGILDSLSTLKLLSFLEERFHVDCEAADIDEGNFYSLITIERFVQSETGDRVM